MMTRIIDDGQHTLSFEECLSIFFFVLLSGMKGQCKLDFFLKIVNWKQQWKNEWKN